MSHPTALRQIAAKIRRRAIFSVRKRKWRRKQIALSFSYSDLPLPDYSIRPAIKIVNQCDEQNNPNTISRLVLRPAENQPGYGTPVIEVLACSAAGSSTAMPYDQLHDGETFRGVRRVVFQRLTVDDRLLAPLLNENVDLRRLSSLNFEFCDFGTVPAADLPKIFAKITADGLALTVDYCRNVDGFLNVITNAGSILSALTVRRRVGDAATKTKSRRTASESAPNKTASWTAAALGEMTVRLCDVETSATTIVTAGTVASSTSSAFTVDNWLASELKEITVGLNDAALRRWATINTFRLLDLNDDYGGSTYFTLDTVLEFIKTRISANPNNLGHYHFGTVGVPYDIFSERLQPCEAGFRLRGASQSLTFRLAERRYHFFTLQLDGNSYWNRTASTVNSPDISSRDLNGPVPASKVRQLFVENFPDQNFSVGRPDIRFTVELCGVST